ncbi:hypothetical protein GCM10010531_43690 [Blastococcus jejuensis]|uniref:DUF4062 domain-containing protein n=1 Tax=Blastococcus jejuensis TaxID=351224 RepID=A0ABP6PUS2_9ACTN
MARPRVFISSTYYDLKHVRASIDLFVRSLGFDSVLSEKGDIAYSFDRPLDESCYAEVGSSDMLVLIIGGRYGAAASDQEPADPKKFFERYESITKREYERAVELDLPIYILIEKSVQAEYRTFLANRPNRDINYAHVDSVNVFTMMEEILGRPRNNPVATFERFTDIENWLREQWAGLFRDLLKRSSQQKQLRALSEQVADLRSASETLKTYVEAVASKVVPEQSEALRDEERRRSSERAAQKKLYDSLAVRYLSNRLDAPRNEVIAAIAESEDLPQLLARLRDLDRMYAQDPDIEVALEVLAGHEDFLADLNIARAALSEPPFVQTSREPSTPRRPRRPSGTRGPSEANET